MSKVESPKLFISYSWSSPEHEQWVLDLATQLRESGVDVILDKWDLREGQDSIAFMEKMVTDDAVRKVVLVCDKKYAQKADQRSGGVGTEAQIISPKVYESVDQTKFVAIIAERDENGKPYIPTYYTSRIYIDLSDGESYGKNLEQLLRWIYDKPLFVKPELGQTPAFLGESKNISLGTGASFHRALDGLKNSRPYAKGALNEYLNTVAVNLEKFRISYGKDESEKFDDLVIENITQFLPYRNELIDIFVAVAQYDSSQETVRVLHHFFESIAPYCTRPQDVASYRDWDYDNFKFIIQELFLYCLAAFLKYEKFQAASFFLNQRYYVSDTDSSGRNIMRSFAKFRCYLSSLKHRNNRLKLRSLSLQSDLLKERNTGASIRFYDLMQADFVAFISDCFQALKDDTRQSWCPDSLLYNRYDRPFEIFSRAESRQFFDKMKVLFFIESKDDFELLMNGFQSSKLRLPKWDFDSISPVHLMAYEKMCSRP